MSKTSEQTTISNNQVEQFDDEANELTDLPENIEIAEKQFVYGQFKTLEKAITIAETAWANSTV